MSAGSRAKAAEIRRTMREPVPDDPSRPMMEWEPFTPLGRYANLPAFPVNALPTAGAEMVAAVAESTQTPDDLAGVVYLGALATSCGGRAVVEVQSGWREPLNIYAAPAMPPGSRKSAVFREMTAPLLDAERAMQENARAVIKEAEIGRASCRERV